MVFKWFDRDSELGAPILGDLGSTFQLIGLLISILKQPTLRIQQTYMCFYNLVVHFLGVLTKRAPAFWGPKMSILGPCFFGNSHVGM